MKQRSGKNFNSGKETQLRETMFLKQKRKNAQAKIFQKTTGYDNCLRLHIAAIKDFTSQWATFIKLTKSDKTLTKRRVRGRF